MAQAGTEHPGLDQDGASASRSGTQPGAVSQALTILPGREDARGREDLRTGASSTIRRPLAGFVAQLMVSEDPRLRPSRGERTRSAAALYAEAARRRA